MTPQTVANLGACYACPARRAAGRGPCPAGRRAILSHAEAGYCPLDRYPSGAAAVAARGGRPASTTARADAMAAASRGLWRELHARAAAAGPDLSGEPAWLRAFARRVPCGECGRHWAELTTATPPDLSSPAAYFGWTVAMHNAVSRRLGKPELSGREAAAELLAGHMMGESPAVLDAGE